MKKNFEIKELMEEELPKPKSNINMPAYKGAPKGFVLDYVIAGCAVVLIPFALWLGLSLEKYRLVGILLAVMGGMGAFSMFMHIELCRKIVKLVTSGKCTTVTSLMAETKKKNREDMIKAIKSTIKDKHLAYYQLENNEKLIKIEEEVEEIVASDVKIIEVVQEEDNREETTDENSNN